MRWCALNPNLVGNLFKRYSRCFYICSHRVFRLSVTFVASHSLVLSFNPAFSLSLLYAHSNPHHPISLKGMLRIGEEVATKGKEKKLCIIKAILKGEKYQPNDRSLVEITRHHEYTTNEIKYCFQSVC